MPEVHPRALQEGSTRSQPLSSVDVRPRWPRSTMRELPWNCARATGASSLRCA